MFSFNETVDKLHWARAVERHHSDNVFKMVGFQVFEIAFHTSRFKLKDTGSFSALQKLIGRLIIKRQLVHVNIFAIDLTNHTQGVIDY